MKIDTPIRSGLAVAALLMAEAAGASWLPAQTQPAKPSAAVSELPAAQPTSGTSQAAPAANAAATPPHHVEVDYTDGKLAVQATNASLNEILREVSQKTGMKITGGVTDDRVFGSYGPAKPSVVLDALLEGMGSNILLVDDGEGKSELILTPRRGNVTPPNPNAEKATESEDNGEPAYVPPARPFQPPIANGRGPGAGRDQGAFQTNQEQEDGNGSRSPQQIYQQLQRTMQQRQGNSQQ